MNTGIQYAPRSIPACAGEPVVGFGALNLAGVYPRVCGGTLCNTPPH